MLFRSIPNRELKHKFRRELDAAGTSQLDIMGLVATEAAYSYGEEWYQSMIEYVRGNIEFTKKYISENIPDVSMIDIEGTYLVWLNFHKTGLSAEELDRRIIHNAKLWLDNGKIFGKCGEGFQRINVACPRSILKEALDRIESILY